MNITRLNGLELHKFESFDESIVGHAFFSRKGGVSPEPWNSLNQGGGLGDPRENIIENRKRSFDAIERDVGSIYDVWQVHSRDIVYTESARPLDLEHIKADAIVTTNPDVTLFMRFADCVPILMYDPKKRVIATVHAGWQGTVKKVVEQTVEFLENHFNVNPEDIVAGIGPSIGVCHYQVGEEVVQWVKSEFPADHSELLTRKNDGWYFDLWKCNELQLLKHGVEKIELAGICTACHTESWYSHRAEKGQTGRFGAALYLK